MTRPTIYGMSASRAFRSIWAAEEIGLDYEHVNTSFRGDAQAEDYLQINPNGRIPALVDGDLKLFESMAINNYLAQAYGAHLWPENLTDQARVMQWSVWGISEIEPLQMQIVVQRFFTPDDKRNEAVIAGATKGLQRPLAVLEQTLSGSDYLLGDELTIADINLAGVMDLLKMIEFDLSDWSSVTAWLERCYGRASYGKAKSVGA